MGANLTGTNLTGTDTRRCEDCKANGASSESCKFHWVGHRSSGIQILRLTFRTPSRDSKPSRSLHLDSSTTPDHYRKSAMSSVSAEKRALRIAQEPLLPVGQTTKFVTGTWSSIKEIWEHRQLLNLLVRREIKARYKDSSLGVVWSLVKPLAQLLVYYFAIGQILGVARNIPSFAIFVFVGLTVWGLFTEIVSSGTMSIINNAGLVKKVYLPREIFPLGAVGGGLFNFGLQLIILLAATIIGGQLPLTRDLALAPLALINVIVFASAIGMVLAAVTVYLRDLQHLVEVVLTVLFWASPVVYSFSFVHTAIAGTWLEQLYLANPVTLSVLGMQKALWLAGTTESNQVNFPPDIALRLWVSLGISIVLLWLAQRIFSRLQGNFAQEL